MATTARETGVDSAQAEQGGQRVLRGDALRNAIIDVASELFAANGIRAISADRVLERVGCSKVSFYRHFATKDDLVVAYLERELSWVASALDAAKGLEGRAALRASMLEQLCAPGFRGCPFVNAAAEYPQADHPVRGVVERFRALMSDAFATWLAAQGVARPQPLARQLMMLRDGALVSGYLDGTAEGATADFLGAVDALLAGSRPEPGA